MSTPKKFGNKDVARWIEGQITDPLEERRIAKEVFRDPDLAAAFEVLADVPEITDSSVDDAQGRLIDANISALANARLWGITLDDSSPDRLLKGKGLSGTVQGSNGFANPELVQISFRLTPNSDNQFELTLQGLPAGVVPINISVGQLGLAEADGVVGTTLNDLKIDFEPKLLKDQKARNEASVVALPPRAGAHIRHEVNVSEGALSASCAAASSRPGRRLMAFLEELEEVVPNCLNLRCEPPEDRDYQIAVLETMFQDTTSDRAIVKLIRALVIERHPDVDYNQNLALDVPVADYLPTNASTDLVSVTLRAGKAEDIRLLSRDDVTNVLAESDFNPFPLTRIGKGEIYRLRILPFELEQIASGKHWDWVLTVAPAMASNAGGATHVGV